jgi:hypothetical protein
MATPVEITTRSQVEETDTGSCCQGSACACTATDDPHSRPEAAHGAASDAAAEIATRSLRTSSYVIYVDLPHNDHEMLLVHSYTGAFDKVSKQIATFVRAKEDWKVPKPLYGDWTPDPVLKSVPEIPDTYVQLLRRRGYLTYLIREEELDAKRGGFTLCLKPISATNRLSTDYKSFRVVSNTAPC